MAPRQSDVRPGQEDDQRGDKGDVERPCDCSNRGRLQSAQPLGHWAQADGQRCYWLPQVQPALSQRADIVGYPSCYTLSVSAKSAVSSGKVALLSSIASRMCSSLDIPMATLCVGSLPLKWWPACATVPDLMMTLGYEDAAAGACGSQVASPLSSKYVSNKWRGSCTSGSSSTGSSKSTTPSGKRDRKAA